MTNDQDSFSPLSALFLENSAANLGSELSERVIRILLRIPDRRHQLNGCWNRLAISLGAASLAYDTIRYIALLACMKVGRTERTRAEVHACMVALFSFRAALADGNAAIAAKAILYGYAHEEMVL